MPIDFRQKKFFVLDMDGTIYLGENAIEGSIGFIRFLEKHNLGFVFFTNNSSKNSLYYKEKLKMLGLEVESRNIITSGMVSAKYIKEQYPGKRVYLLGTKELFMDFNEKGILLVEEDPDIVVAGFDTTIDFQKLSKACTFIRNGSVFIATHPDLNCPTETGFIPDCGAICAFITASTDKKPKYIGKPYIETLDYLLEYFNCTKDEMVFIGDRLYTDIAIGFKNNVGSVLVLTGETKKEDIEQSEFKPDLVLEKLFDLKSFIE